VRSHACGLLANQHVAVGKENRGLFQHGAHGIKWVVRGVSRGRNGVVVFLVFFFVFLSWLHGDGSEFPLRILVLSTHRLIVIPKHTA
jgi:hypothetical protein